MLPVQANGEIFVLATMCRQQCVLVCHGLKAPLTSFACNQNTKEDIPTELKVFLCFETKRNETKHKQIPHEHTHELRE